MAVNLTQAQLSELSSIANSGQSGARVAYYTKLAEFGIAYGSLALGVVLDDQISGRVANSYFMAVAEREGVSVSSSQWAAIGDALMHADITARLAAPTTIINGEEVTADLGYFAIREYHQAVFSTLGGAVTAGDGVSINAWTAYAPVETFGPGTWDQMLSDATLYQHAYGAALLGDMWFYSMFQDDTLASEWASIMTEPVFQSLLATGSPAVFPNQIEDSYLILGTHSADQLSIDAAIPAETQVLLMGLGGADTITVQGHGDYFDGGADNDTFIVTALEGDFMHGSTGEDVADFSQLTEGIQVQAETGSTAVFSGFNFGSVRSVESIVGTSHDDSFAFYGSLAAQDIESIDAGAGTDTVYLNDAVEQLHVDLEDGRILGIRDITATGIENIVGGEGSDTILGSAVANNLQGGLGDDQIEGRDGNDSLWGQSGDDVLIGGLGADDLYGGEGNDTLQGDEGNDNLYADAGNDNLEGGDGNDDLSGDEGDDHIWGDAGRDYLFGGDGDDFLFGGDGDDVLDGETGFNVATGGLGADRFYVSGDGNTTLITDFELGIDHLSNGSSRISYADSSDGLRLEYADGAIALLAEISTATPDWMIYV